MNACLFFSETGMAKDTKSDGVVPCFDRMMLPGENIVNRRRLTIPGGVPDLVTE
jgi:hypothetical protein